MSAAFKNRSALIIDTGTGRSVPWPTGHHAGDYAILVAAKADTSSNAETLSTPAGFTLIGSAEQNVGGVFSHITAWYCVATSSAMTTPVVAADHLGSSSTAVMFTFSGCSNAAPDASLGSANSGNSISIGGVTTTQVNDLVVNISCQFTTSGSNSISGWTNSNLANIVEFFDQSAQLTGLGSQGLGCAMAAGCARATGATGATTATWAGTGGFLGSGSMQIALKSAAATVVSTDATAGKWKPATEAEWNSLLWGDGLATPALALNCQDASGAPVDAIGGVLFSISGTPTYANTVPGWTAKALICRQSQSDMFTYGGWSDFDSYCISWLNYPSSNAAVNQGSIITYGSTFSRQAAIDLGAASTKFAGVTHNDTLTPSTNNHTGVHLTQLQASHTDDLLTIQTDLETVTKSPGNWALDIFGAFTLGGNNANYWQGTGVGFMMVASFASFNPASGIRNIYADRLNNGPAYASIAITPSSATIGTLGGTQACTATGTRGDTSTGNITSIATWSSDAPSIATVNSSGVVTGVAVGTAHITCTYTSLGAAQATSNTVTITVTSGSVTLQSITITASSAPVAGCSVQFTATGHYSDSSTADITSQVTWASSNPSVARIDPKTGIADFMFTAGNCQITATL